MKHCELCNRTANMYCESDRAALCWSCDAKVHGANFLVERHSRNLLCRRCQSPTAWRATGAHLSPIVSSCDRCAAIDNCQVALWKTTTPPPAASCSSDEESSASRTDLCSEVEENSL